MSEKANKVRIGLRVYSDTSWMGGVHYVLNWVKALNFLPAEEKPEVYLIFYNEPGSFDMLSFQIAKKHAHHAKAIRPITDVPKLNLDLFYPVTNIFEAPFDAPWAGWIPDWQCKYLPEMFDEFEIARRDHHFRLLTKEAPFLVLSSQMAYDDTRRIVGENLVPMEKLPFPAVLDEYRFDENDIRDALARHRVPSRFFLVCNKFWKHKNHLVIFKALAKLSDPSIICVFTGDTTDHRWPEYFEQIKTHISNNNLPSSIRLLGQISREDQLKLMQASLAVIQPSRFEGWSTVVEEAKALNKTLILSKFSVHLEQAPKGSRFFDPDDDEELAGLINELWNSHPSDPADLANKDHQDTHKQYIIECARQFVNVAKKTRENYDPFKHDINLILLRFLNRIKIEENNSVQHQVYKWSVDKTIAKFRKEPIERVFKFRELCLKYLPDFFPTAENLIISAVLAKHSANELYLYLKNTKQLSTKNEFLYLFKNIFSFLKRSIISCKKNV
ncbi:glycosyltransferase [Thermodesulfobacteriota bacterium]